tara:strand:- start:3535 stop:4428 length:894 start_codon:yes stop_codon:yes gene_type:complete
MIVLLHGTKINKKVHEQIVNFIDELQNNNFKILCTSSFYNNLNNLLTTHNKKNITSISNIDDYGQSIDYLFCFGGDGTILSAATIIQDKNIPIVGINTGRLGFLATISKHELPNLINNLKNKHYKLSARSLLQINSNDTIIDTPFALNEISVSSKEKISMINIKVLLNNEYLNTYWADGLIVSTPTGSTGYSLSCGGPIVMPESNNLIITPIAPHNLNVRPLIISDDNVITIEILDNNSRKFLLSMDSRNQYIKNSTRITLKKAPYTIKLVEIDSINYSKTLREKLLWGLDRRNHEL